MRTRRNTETVHHSPLAQQLEPLFYTQKVAGAIPARRTIYRALPERLGNCLQSSTRSVELRYARPFMRTMKQKCDLCPWSKRGDALWGKRIKDKVIEKCEASGSPHICHNHPERYCKGYKDFKEGSDKASNPV